MSRREFSNKVKMQAALRANGHCERCSAKLFIGSFHYDHAIPDALGGEPVLENCAVVCKACHSAKTTTSDVPNIARAKRRQQKHLGIRKPSTLPCGRDSPWKKKLSGEVVRR